MKSRIKFEYLPNGNLDRVDFLTDKLYAGSVATAVYILKMAEEHNADNWLPSDLVYINFKRPDNLESTVIMNWFSAEKEWRCTTNGFELNYDADNETVLTISFLCKRPQLLQPNTFITKYSQSANVTVYPSGNYIPAEIDHNIAQGLQQQITQNATDIDDLETSVGELESDITALENGLDNKVERKTASGLHAYTYNGAGDTETEISQLVKPNTIPLRTSSGELEVDLVPESNNSATSKKYVDDNDSNTLNTAKDYTDTKIADLVGSAPELLDTLEEIAEAINNNEEFGSYVVNKFAEVNTNLNNKINKSDRYLDWQELIAVDGQAAFDFYLSDKYYIDTASEITLDIVNAPDGLCGLVKVSGGGRLIFPSGSIYNADSEYLNAESGQSYLYSFVSLNGIYMINRTVLNG